MIGIKDVSLNDASLVGVNLVGTDLEWIVEGGWINDRSACFKVCFHNVGNFFRDSMPFPGMYLEGEDGDLLGFHYAGNLVKVVVEWWMYPPAHLKPKSYEFTCSGISIDLIAWVDAE